MADFLKKKPFLLFFCRYLFNVLINFLENEFEK